MMGNGKPVLNPDFDNILFESRINAIEGKVNKLSNELKATFEMLEKDAIHQTALLWKSIELINDKLESLERV